MENPGAWPVRRSVPMGYTAPMKPAAVHAPTRAPRAALSSTTIFWICSAATFLFVFACYWPLTRYFFAQDDFVFLDRATRGFEETMRPYFHGRPGQFRPLTKGVYFLMTWPVFGFHPLPYHVMSLALHALNAILVGVVLRRFGISTVISWVAVVLFAANMCHMEAIAWISCVQQLIGTAFVLTTLIYGVDAMRDGGRRAIVLATVGYALALASYEQTMATPLVLLIWAWVGGGFRAAWRAAWGPVRPMLVLLAIYTAYTLIRGMPETGPYVMSAGHNVRDNLSCYLSFVFSFWMLYPAYALPSGITSSTGVWIALIVVHTLLRSGRQLIFGLATFLLFLAPVMFTKDHTHSFHLYVSAIGAWFLLGSAGDLLRRVAGAGWGRAVVAAAIVAATVVAAGASPALHRNMNATVEIVALPRSFVLRRAILAERMCTNIKQRWTGETTGRLILFYPGTHPANYRNIQVALGYGAGVKVLVERPDLEVVFVPPAEMPDSIQPGELMVYSELGACYRLEEWRELERQAEERKKQNP